MSMSSSAGNPTTYRWLTLNAMMILALHIKLLTAFHKLDVRVVCGIHMIIESLVTTLQFGILVHLSTFLTCAIPIIVSWPLIPNRP